MATAEEKVNLPRISVIVPCWNEAEVLPLFYQAMAREMSQRPDLEWELLLVDDGSTDGTLSQFRDLRRMDKRVRYASFSRNFGKEAAVLCGLRMATGDFLAFVDADLQHPPALLGQMYDILRDDPDTDVVGARRVDRAGESPVRSFLARGFYGVVNRLSDLSVPQGATDFRLMRRRVAEAILSLPEHSRFTKGLFALVGFPTRWLEYENVNRAAGESKWSLRALLQYSLDGICALSLKPLRFAFFSAALLGLGALALFVCALCLPASRGGLALGGLLCLVGALLLGNMGIQSQYLGKIYQEVKARPLYFVRETSEERPQ